MKSRSLPLFSAVLLTPALLSAQVRPVFLSPVASAPGAVAGAGASVSAAAALPVLSPLAAPLALSAAPLAAPSAPEALPAAAPMAAAASVPAAKPVRAELSALTAAPAGAPALSALESGRRVFDGAALEGPTAGPVRAAAPAPRGDSLQFNGVSLPTRMFSDQTQISDRLVAAIDATKKTLDIAIYEMSLRNVLAALQRAKARGVKIRIVMDQGHVYPEKPGWHDTPEVQALIAAGFEMKTLRGGDRYGIMHNKFAVFDGQLMEAGSYNWSYAADTMHFENAYFDDAAHRVASFQRYWDWMWAKARPVDLNNPPPKLEFDPNPDVHAPPLPPAPQDPDRPLTFNGARFPNESFTPQGTAALVAAAIDASAESVDLANFSFTNDQIIAALKRAKDRGIKVRLIFDRYQYGFLKEMQDMATMGFDVRLSAGRNGPGQKGVMHNKYGVFDGRLVETGSFNWTMNGELNNYENAAFMDAPDDVAGYAAYFQRIWDQAQAPTAADHRLTPEQHQSHHETLGGASPLSF
jgi:phosphatidylserine/phosphatidylglycerophosphate/cardiolipin synthase-like enzyme